MKENTDISHLIKDSTYVVLDVETTGLNPKRDRIIEIGLVKISGAEITDEFTSLFDPGIIVPDEITLLTSITNEQCKSQPKFSDMFDDIVRFIGKSIIVAHNAQFDLQFIRNAVDQDMIPEELNRDYYLDTLELSRILLPILSSHSLENLLSYFNIEISPLHRALSDAKGTAYVFLELLKRINLLARKTLHTLNLLTSGNFSPLSEIFSRAEKLANKDPDAEIKELFNQKNIIGSGNVTYSGSTPKSELSENLVEEFFAPAGFLSGIFPFYEPRLEQQELAKLVTRTFNRNEFLLAEAGTGVGKSLGYLVPAVVWVQNNPGERVVISTNTKNLQDQLFYKDLPPLLKSRGVSAVLLKGRANYLCPLRWQHMISEGFNYLSPDLKKSLLNLVLWAETTKTGDIEENPGYRGRGSDYLWSLLNADSMHCKRSACPYFSDCFYQRVKNAAMSAGIVVVNHSLLFSDVASGRQILGQYDTLIIDEAHHAENSASNCLTRGLTIWNCFDLSDRISGNSNTKTGIIPVLTETVKKLKDRNAINEAEKLIIQLEDFSLEFRETSALFFEKALVQARELNSSKSFNKIRIKTENSLPVFASEEQAQIKRVLKKITNSLERIAELAENYGDLSRELYNAVNEIEAVISVSAKIKESFSYFTGAPPEQDIVWMEIVEQAKTPRVDFYWVPLNVGNLLAGSLYPGLKRCVMTSATLRVGDSFEYIKTRLGLNLIESEMVNSADLGSPYSFKNQALMLLPSFISDPRNRDFEISVGTFLERLISENLRGTLVLFTSYSMLVNVTGYLAPLFSKMGVTLLSQKPGVSRTVLLDRFRKNKKSVLLATSSFWEGIDVPGESLEQLVIVKLPFSMPSEPVVEARTEDVQKKTGNGFINYSIPEAVVRLRQGVGRLIRSHRDRGVVIILDKRLISTSYGNIFVSSLPSNLEVINKEDVFFSRIKQWFNGSYI